VDCCIHLVTLTTDRNGRYGSFMAQAPYTLRRWTRADYERVVSLGVFENEHLELIGGDLIVAEPIGPYHVTSLGKTGEALRAGLPNGWIIRGQSPIALDDESEPEPDLAVVRGTWDDFRDAHPSRPALVIEIAESSLLFDRNQKGSAYARAGLADYWIVNLVDRVLEIYRDPVPDPSARYEWRYASVRTLTESETVVPLALPTLQIAVADLLP
jgi:Uma2 family endonuclease